MYQSGNPHLELSPPVDAPKSLGLSVLPSTQPHLIHPENTAHANRTHCDTFTDLGSLEFT